MPEIEKAKLDEMLKDVPADKRDDFLTDFKNRGFTVKTTLPMSTAGQPIYPPQQEIGKLPAAEQALGQAAATPIPGVAPVVESLREGIPSAIAEKAGALAEKAGPLGPAIRGVGIGLAGTLGTAGELLPKTVGDVAAQELGGAALKGAGAAGRAVAPVAKEVGIGLLARDIGVAEPFIKNALSNPAELKRISEDPLVIKDYISHVGKIMKSGLDKAASGIETIEDKYLQKHLTDPENMPRADFTPQWEKFKTELLQRGLSTAEKGEALTPSEAKRLASSIPAIQGEDAKKMIDYVSLLRGRKDNLSFLDLLNLRRRIGDDIAWKGGDAPKVGSQAQKILKGLYSDINNQLYKMEPGLKTANEQYTTARKAYDSLSAKVFGDNPETAYNRIKLRIQRGIAPSALVERANKIDSASESAMKRLIDKVSAQQFAPYVRKGIGGGFLGMGAVGSAAAAGAGAMTGHGLQALYPLIAESLAVAGSSPRLAALGIQGAGGASDAMASLARQMAARKTETELTARAATQAYRSKKKEEEK